MRREATIHPAACHCRPCQTAPGPNRRAVIKPGRLLFALALISTAFGTALTLFN